jgi:hypothetical protein
MVQNARTAKARGGVDPIATETPPTTKMPTIT